MAALRREEVPVDGEGRGLLALRDQRIREAQVRFGRDHPGARRALLERDARQQQLRVRVRELDVQVAVDREHALLRLPEHAFETVALGAQLLEVSAESGAHAVDQSGDTSSPV